MRLLKLLFFLGVLALTPVASYASPTPPSSILMLPIGNEDEEPSKGIRMPSLPLICKIDFFSMEIKFNKSLEVSDFELWDEEGSCLFISSQTDSDIVQFMADTYGSFQLRLTTQECTYVGYICCEPFLRT